MRRNTHGWVAGILVLAACRSTPPSSAPAPTAARPAPGGLGLTLVFTPPSHAAVYEWRQGQPLQRLSPLSAAPDDSLTLPTPPTPGAQPRRAELTPRIVVTTPSGWEQPFGQAETWNSARVLWTPQREASRRPPVRSVLWFVVRLAEPVTAAQDAAASKLSLPCCDTAARMAAEAAAGLEIPAESVWVVWPGGGE